MTTKITIEIVVTGNASAAREAIDRALDAGTIQEAILECADDAAPNFDIDDAGVHTL